MRLAMRREACSHPENLEGLGGVSPSRGQLTTIRGGKAAMICSKGG
jgi:hypothetical protein